MARVLCSVYTGDTGFCWPVAQSPNEVEEEVKLAEEVGEPFVELALGDHSNCMWNGRTIKVRAASITALAPPLNDEAASVGEVKFSDYENDGE